MSRASIAIAIALTGWSSVVQPASAGHLTTVDIDGQGATWLYSINSKGWIVGVGGGSAFVLEKNGTLVPFTILNAGIAFPTINVHGEVAGSADINCGDGSTCSEGFFRSVDGAISTFSALTGGDTGVSGLNSKGQIAGSFWNSTSLSQGFIRQPDGSINVVDVPGAVFTQLTAINDRGWTAGAFNDGAWHGLLVAPDGKQTAFDIPVAGQFPSINGMNDNGWIVGWYYNSDNSTSTGYVRAPNGKITPINIAGASYVAPVSINKSGDVAGTYRLGKHVYGFVRWSSGELTTIKVKHGDTEPASINDQGRVVGTYLVKDRFGPTHYFGFIWRP